MTASCNSRLTQKETTLNPTTTLHLRLQDHDISNAALDMTYLMLQYFCHSDELVRKF